MAYPYLLDIEPKNYPENTMHLIMRRSPIEPSDFCETDIVFEVYPKGGEPRMEGLAASRETFCFDDLYYGIVIKSQLNNVLQEDPQEVRGDIPTLFLRGLCSKASFLFIFFWRYFKVSLFW